MSEKHTILEGKVHLYRRNGSPTWQCSTYLNSRNWRVSTKESSLSKAKEWAEDWFFNLKDVNRRAILALTQFWWCRGSFCADHSRLQ
ncbi:MAG: hypothetical protein F9K19_26420 [Rhizobiaceae bacterium]|nr:MAG: hypothetical protein F9K19_26420 [Rhizobiaceae bacterium]CAG1011879.1 hypothetical protein RHIZO_04135 [Rhizobiaceae bacterium]